MTFFVFEMSSEFQRNLKCLFFFTKHEIINVSENCEILSYNPNVNKILKFKSFNLKILKSITLQLTTSIPYTPKNL